MNKGSTSFQVVTTFGTKIIILFGSFIISVILARLLGPEGKGIVTAVFVVPNLIITLADLGIRQATAYHIGKKLYKTEEIISSVMIVWLIASLLSLAVAVTYYTTGSVQSYGWLIITIALITIPLKILSKYFQGILQGQIKIGTFNISELLSFFVNLLGVLLLVWLFNLDIIGAALVQLLMGIVMLVYLTIVITKKFKITFKYNKEVSKSLFNHGIKFALALFILTLNYRVDIIFLEQMTSPESVGIYSIGTNLSELIWKLPAAMGMVLFAKSASSKVGDEKTYLRAVKLLRMSMPLLLCICLLLWIMAPFLVSVIYGEEFISSVEVIRILLPGIFVIVISKILHPDLAGRGFPLYAFWVFVGPLILNIILNLILIPKYGMSGAAWASTISYSLGGLLFGIVYSRKEQIPLRTVLFLQLSDIKEVINKFKKAM
ncbi:oligosaccharide flippase family protein [Bacillus sp. FJAT-44742]|uniref:oligosaccharide flippase family protein n=1 Tax=Bacillus sp. FJAT-44742 TaxID=2014005 RepID=UPI0018E278FC|nr:oligosaccharide flippase family protein [Bacillus sp. FJAT-44742]